MWRENVAGQTNWIAPNSAVEEVRRKHSDILGPLRHLLGTGTGTGIHPGIREVET